MQNPLANFIGVFSLVRVVRGFQVNPICRHNITRSDQQIGNCLQQTSPIGVMLVIHKQIISVVPLQVLFYYYYYLFCLKRAN